MKVSLCVTVTALMSLSAILAQRHEGAAMIVRGEIVSGRAAAGSLTVELSGSGMSQAESVSVNPDNTFEFRSVTPGMHELRVLGNAGQVLHEETVNIANPNQVISIRMVEPASANRATDGVISLQQLRHKVPPQARKAFDAGEQALAKGDLVQARSSFQEAVTIDPEFADAHNELGGAEAGLKHLPEAAEQFQKAIELVPEHPMALPNLSIVLAKMDRLKEAAQVARRALQITPTDGRLHYIVAANLLRENGTMQEVVSEFERAVGSVPAAHLVLAELFARQDRVSDAREHLQAYLAIAKENDPLRPKVEARLASMPQ
jgi:tetratricopeptide (TPR) repeat protein